MANIGHMVKEQMAADIALALGEQPNVFVASVNRLPASETDSLRKKLSGSQARLLMVKRRLGKRVAEQLKLTGLAELIEGSVGLVLVGDDVLPAAKTLIEFTKGHEEQLVVRGGFVDGQVLDKSRVVELAGLPPKPVLLAQVLGMIEAPMSDLIFTVEQLIGDVAWIAEQAAASKPAAEQPVPATEQPNTAQPTEQPKEGA